jgi:hypothetical protein
MGDPSRYRRNDNGGDGESEEEEFGVIQQMPPPYLKEGHHENRHGEGDGEMGERGMNLVKRGERFRRVRTVGGQDSTSDQNKKESTHERLLIK